LGNQPVNVYLATEQVLVAWIRGLAADREVLSPQRLGKGSFEFRPVDEHSELVLGGGFRASLNPVPPGRAFMPAREELFRFRRGPNGRIEFVPSFDRRSRVLAGVRPCDLDAIRLMDRVHTENGADPGYLTRRSHTTIIAIDCLRPCDEHCFCAATGSLQAREGADVFLTPLANGFLVECLSERGEALVEGGDFESCSDPGIHRAWAESNRAEPFGRQLRVPVSQLPDRLSKVWDSQAWTRHTERCFSCGTCNIVCPTCYCFDLVDEVDLAEPFSGRRSRVWDACMLEDFAEVAGGHNFRGEPAARQRHRVKRKFEYLPRRYGELSFCVGCGRCGHQCTAGIDIFDIVNDAVGEAI